MTTKETPESICPIVLNLKLKYQRWQHSFSQHIFTGIARLHLSTPLQLEFSGLPFYIQTDVMTSSGTTVLSVLVPLQTDTSNFPANEYLRTLLQKFEFYCSNQMTAPQPPSEKRTSCSYICYSRIERVCT